MIFHNNRSNLSSSQFAAVIGLGLALAGPSLCFGQTLNLGQAATFTVLETPGSGGISVLTSTIGGNVGLDQSYSALNDTVNGNIYIGTGITGSSSHTNVTGSVVTGSNLTGAVSAADQVASTAAGWTGTGANPNANLLQNSGIGSNYIFTGSSSHSGQNVLAVTSSLSISGGSITINGTASEQFVFNISNLVTFSQTSIILNGVSAGNVFFNILHGGSLTASGGTFTGNILSLNGGSGVGGTVNLSSVTMDGSVISSGSLSISGSSVAIAPEMPTILLGVSALLLLVGKAGLDRFRQRRTG